LPWARRGANKTLISLAALASFPQGKLKNGTQVAPKGSSGITARRADEGKGTKTTSRLNALPLTGIYRRNPPYAHRKIWDNSLHHLTMASFIYLLPPILTLSIPDKCVHRNPSTHA